MRLIVLGSLLSLTHGASFRRDVTPSKGMAGMGGMGGMNSPPKAASPLGAFLATLTDIEPIMKGIQPFIGSYLRNPVLVSGLAERFLNKATLHSQKDLEPKLRKGAKRTVFRYGPFKMYGQGQTRPSGGFPSLDPDGQGFLFTIDTGLCKNCTILSGQPGLAFEDGTPTSAESGLYIHHILSGELSDPGLMAVSQCDYPTTDATQVPDLLSHPFFRGFIGQGEDDGDTGIIFTSPNGDFKSGFQMNDKFKVLVQADFMNYSNQTKDVYMTIDLEYVDGHVGDPAVTNLLSVTGCKLDSAKSDKKGPAITQSQKFPVLVDGTLLAAKGHLHIGGSAMELSVNDKVVCTSNATYNSAGVITGMTACAPMAPVKRGDYLSMKSIYDLAAHPPRQGVDGSTEAHNIMGGMDLMGMWEMTYSMKKTY